MSLKGTNVLVTGGSRGLGLGLVEALVAHGARVTVVARGAEALDSVRARLGVATTSADVTHETPAHRILAEVLPMVSRRKRASGFASRRSCRSKWSSAPGSAMRAPTPMRTPWA